MKKLFLLFLSLLLVLTACGEARDGDVGDLLPGSIQQPVLQVNGRHYYWQGVADGTCLAPNGAVVKLSQGQELPTGYQRLSAPFLDSARSAGTISSITEEPPTEDLQLQAGFTAEGEVLVNDHYPEVVYVRMTTDWFQGSLIRFTSGAMMGGECVFYQGHYYRLSVNRSATPRAEALPQGCVQAGNLHFAGWDVLPADDLATNCLQFPSCGGSPEGLAVWVPPGKTDALYIASQIGRSSTWWYACPLQE